MTSEELPDAPPPDDSSQRGLLKLALLAALGGVVTGVLGGLFRLALRYAGQWWEALLVWCRDLGGVRLLLPVVLAALAVAAARAIVRWAPESAGSGVQRVEAMVRHEGHRAPLRVIPAKFVGGTLALGVGMALGREGPTVQMGAAVGGEVSRRASLDPHDTRTLSSALAGAGLGVAFSAPLGGAVFVLEELDRAIRTRLLVATLIGSSVALATAYLIVGREPVLPVGRVDQGPLWVLPLYVVLGALVAVLGMYYNRLIVWNLDLMHRWRSWPAEAKAAVIGAVVGLLGVAAPWLVGGGEILADRVLNVDFPFGTLLVILLVRWFLGPLSYSAGTPGGLFAPLLVVGATIGSVLAVGVNTLIPSAGLPVAAFAIVGMSAFFAAVVRSPLTGIVLCVEMTATTAVLVPMLIAAGTAMVVCTMLGSTPIYDVLRERLIRAQGAGDAV